MGIPAQRAPDPAAAAAAVAALATVEGRDDLYAHYDTLRASDPIHRSRPPTAPGSVAADCDHAKR